MAAGQESHQEQGRVQSTGEHQHSRQVVHARELGYAYQETTALSGVSFGLPAGETLAVVGPSGCGKTTLLSLIAGLIQPTSGKLEVTSKNHALILQDYGLLPWKTVRENAALGLQIRRQPWTAADQALAEVGLGDLKDRWPHQLSGGQRQRVAIARALALEPDLLMMDEPFSALDALTREEMQDLLIAIWRRRGSNIIIVTHSIAEAVYLGQQILVLSPRPGRPVAAFRNAAVGDRRSSAFHQMVNAVRDSLERGVVQSG